MQLQKSLTCQTAPKWKGGGNPESKKPGERRKKPGELKKRRKTRKKTHQIYFSSPTSQNVIFRDENAKVESTWKKTFFTPKIFVFQKT